MSLDPRSGFHFRSAPCGMHGRRREQPRDHRVYCPASIPCCLCCRFGEGRGRVRSILKGQTTIVADQTDKIGYPNLSSTKSGHLTVEEHPHHQIYWEEYGSPDGEPVVFMHGGPGAGSHKSFARFFNPERYRVILFDQRGCGKSTPSAGDDDPTPALGGNTTGHLIGDVMRLRRELDVHGKMHVFGGSWGSTLALAYAIAHPETVQTLILRGVFLCRRIDVDYFFQGNAADFAANPLARQ